MTRGLSLYFDLLKYEESEILTNVIRSIKDSITSNVGKGNVLNCEF